MKTIRLHIFKDNTALAEYAHRLCRWFKQHQDMIEVKDDLACLDTGQGLVAMTKCIHTAKQIASVSDCVTFHFIPKIEDFDRCYDVNQRTIILKYY